MAKTKNYTASAETELVWTGQKLVQTSRPLRFCPVHGNGEESAVDGAEADVLPHDKGEHFTTLTALFMVFFLS